MAVKHAILSAQTGLEVDTESGLILEALAAYTAASSEDKREGSQAFLEKRPPRFKGW